jgi:hypothetical protein
MQNRSPEVARDVEQVKEWLKIELTPRGLDLALKAACIREIQKTIAGNSHQQVKIALLSLIASGLVADLSNLSPGDIENALWLIRDMRIGFDDNAPLAQRLNYL